MKKLLAIVVLGLLLNSCSNQTQNLLENCADSEFKKRGGEFVDDPLNIRNKTPKEKLKNKEYDFSWNSCERQLKKYPRKFKIKYKD